MVTRDEMMIFCVYFRLIQVLATFKFVLIKEDYELHFEEIDHD